MVLTRALPIGPSPTRTAIKVNDTAVLATGSVTVIAAFRDFTPYDAVLTAIFKRNFNGQIPLLGANVEIMPWTSDAINNLQEIRRSFCVDA